MGRITETNPTSTPTKINFIGLLYWCVPAAILFLLLGPLFSKRDPFFGIVLTEAVAIFLPAIYFRGRYGGKKHGGMALGEAGLLTVAVFPIILVINGIFLDALSRIYLLENQNLDLLRGDVGLFKQILTMALAPAIMEEFFFRGVLCSFPAGAPGAPWFYRRHFSPFFISNCKTAWLPFSSDWFWAIFTSTAV